eukprot:10434357-Lingulodinium_polyedra.AAC.1
MHAAPIDENNTSLHNAAQVVQREVGDEVGEVGNEECLAEVLEGQPTVRIVDAARGEHASNGL